jgi:hypothetical protein
VRSVIAGKDAKGRYREDLSGEITGAGATLVGFRILNLDREDAAYLMNLARHDLGDPLDHSLGQGPRMAQRIRVKAAAGCISSDLGAGSLWDIEEEGRLLYVGMTRAKDSLELTIPQRFYVHQQSAGGDRHVYGRRTRFIPSAILDAFAERSWAPARPTPTKPSSGRQADLSARMKEMWR